MMRGLLIVTVFPQWLKGMALCTPRLVVEHGISLIPSVRRLNYTALPTSYRCYYYTIQKPRCCLAIKRQRG